MKKKLWFSEALSLWRIFGVVPGLQAGQDFNTAWYGDSLTRVQMNLATGNILSANFLYNQSYQADAGLGALTPFSTTTQIPARRCSPGFAIRFCLAGHFYNSASPVIRSFPIRIRKEAAPT